MLVAEEGGGTGAHSPPGLRPRAPSSPGTPLCPDLQLPSHIRSRSLCPGQAAAAGPQVPRREGGSGGGGAREGDGSGKPQAQLDFPRGPCGSSGVHPRAPPPGGAQGAREAATRMGCGDPSTRQGVQARLHSSPGGGRGHWGLHPECGFTGASPQAGPEPRLLTLGSCNGTPRSPWARGTCHHRPPPLRQPLSICSTGRGEEGWPLSKAPGGGGGQRVLRGWEAPGAASVTPRASSRPVHNRQTS